MLPRDLCFLRDLCDLSLCDLSLCLCDLRDLCDLSLCDLRLCILRDLRDLSLCDLRDLSDLRDPRDLGDLRDLNDLGDLRDLRDLGDLRDLSDLGDLRDLSDLGIARTDGRLHSRGITRASCVQDCLDTSDRSDVRCPGRESLLETDTRLRACVKSAVKPPFSRIRSISRMSQILSKFLDKKCDLHSGKYGISK